MTLSTADFDAFFEAVHNGHGPFPWQKALLDRLVATGWPDGIDVPTGLGKTAVLDVAVFAQALGVPAARRRIFLVIDRRVVVDQAYEHARAIEAALLAPNDPVVARVAHKLRPDATGDEPESPLVVGRMRGGLTWSWRWLDRPDQPAIVTGTIDQLGSRLLFRGYGVGEHLRPIDAALVGTESLILVDEAHLAGPLLTTLERATEVGQARDSGLAVSTPTVVVMSATVGRTDAELHRISDIDREHEVAGPRLTAAKQLHLVDAKVTKKRAVDDTAKVLARVATQLGESGADVVGVVANTVATARKTFDLLAAATTDAADGAVAADSSGAGATDEDHKSGDRVVLLTGRQRPLDRDRLLATWLPRIKAGRDRREDGPLYVVATQTIEVGADLDFAALVTESASLDALVQRLGRLNRRAKWDEAPAVVVHPEGLGEDPIYGAARAATWDWLTEKVAPVATRPTGTPPQLGEGWPVAPGELAQVLRDLAAEERAAMRSPQPVVPVLFRWILDCWAQTSPAPAHSPPVGPFLHGLEEDQPTVSVLWRDIAWPSEDVVVEPATGGAQGSASDPLERALAASIEELPAAVEEQIELPLVAVRRWMNRAPGAAAIPDAETFHDDGETTTTTDDDSRKPARALRLGDDPPRLVGGNDLRPGDVLVVPTDAGGLDAYGWAPDSPGPAVDIADLATRRGGRALRVDPARLKRLLHREGIPLETAEGDDPLKVDLDLSDPAAAAWELVDALTRHLDQELGEVERETSQLWPLLRDVADPNRRPVRRGRENGEVVGDPASAKAIVFDAEPPDEPVGPWPSSWRVLQRAQPRRVGWRRLAAGAGWQSDEGVAMSSATGTGEPVSLEKHHAAVAKRAEVFADAFRLAPDVRETVVAAAGWHDLGKADPRFQSMLRGGLPVTGSLSETELLAKSGMDPADRAAFRDAARLSGYPPGMRHEAYSLAAVAAADTDSFDADLLRHLVAAHHGRSRPLLPPIIDDAPMTYRVAVDGHEVEVSSAVSVDLDGPRRFEALNRRFGPWGLALLETIVRLADIGCSEEGT